VAHEWIQRLGTKPSAADTPDAPTRSERYIAVVDPYWSNLKADIRRVIQQYQKQDRRGRVFVEEHGRRLSLRGDCYGLDLMLIVERELVHVRYWQLPGRRPIRPATLDLRLDMRSEYLVLLDCAGCPVDDPVRFVLEPFLEALVQPDAGVTPKRTVRW
jgi:hypothetical protein